MDCPNPVLPELLVENVQVTSLFSNEEGLADKERRSLFRALTLYLNSHSKIDVHTAHLFL